MTKHFSPVKTFNKENSSKYPLKNELEKDINRLKEEKSQQGKIKEKVWLIRRIGDLLGEDTKTINEKRLKIKKKIRGKYKKFQREAETLLNLIN